MHLGGVDGTCAETALQFVGAGAHVLSQRTSNQMCLCMVRIFLSFGLPDDMSRLIFLGQTPASECPCGTHADANDLVQRISTPQGQCAERYAAFCALG